MRQLEEENDSPSGIRIIGVGKTYKANPCCRSTRDVHALKGVHLEIPDKELFCLLGHNGAGKTTTISMLTGLYAATSGRASVLGLNVFNEMPEVRKILGVCP